MIVVVVWNRYSKVRRASAKAFPRHESAVSKRSEQPVGDAPVNDLNQANVTNVHAGHVT